MLIELSSLGNRYSLRGNIGSKSAILLQRGPVNPRFQVEVVAPHQPFFSCQKNRLNGLSYGIQICTDFCSLLPQSTRLTDRLTDRRREFSSLDRVYILCSAVKTEMAISSNYVVHVAMFCGDLSNKIRKNEQINTAKDEVKCTLFKISVRQKVVGETSWLAHWEQKVGGQLPALPNRLRRQWIG